MRKTMEINPQVDTVIRLNMGQWYVSKSSTCELLAPSLGSCVALCLYDKINKIGGMAHIVLPSRILREANSGNFQAENYPSAKYADEVIMIILAEMIKQTGNSELNLVAKIAGGAQMFSGVYKAKLNGSKAGFPLIGQTNSDTIRKELQKFNIPLLALDVGGTSGRVVTFKIQTGEMRVRHIGASEELVL
jgi:chemotaxis protein CheD